MNTHHSLSMIVREVLADFIAGCPLAPEAMTDETVLVDGLGMDSLERIEIAVRLEDIFDIELANIPAGAALKMKPGVEVPAIDRVKTVGELTVLVARLKFERHGEDEE